MQILVEKSKSPKPKAPEKDLGFGRYFTDHIFTMEYDHGWKNAKILPYGPLVIDPGASVFHYGQAMFEGLKAFRTSKGKIQLFRPDFNARRMAEGAERLCMPAFPVDAFIEATRALVDIDRDWVPTERGAALYIRPTLIGTEAFLGVRPAEKYLFFIMLSPVGSYYAEGLAPVKIWIEKEFVRAAQGGLGAVKAGANYAASLLAGVKAKKSGYSQVLWLDAERRDYIEEVGTMNVFFAIGDEVITPPLSGTILGGGTRDSVLRILKEWGVKVVERRISLNEISAANQRGILKEAFGTGTAAVISAVGELASESEKIILNNRRVGELTKKLYDELTAIQYGEKPDDRGWIVPV